MTIPIFKCAFFVTNLCAYILNNIDFCIKDQVLFYAACGHFNGRINWKFDKYRVSFASQRWEIIIK
jgi:hypothetical protein